MIKFIYALALCLALVGGHGRAQAASTLGFSAQDRKIGVAEGEFVVQVIDETTSLPIADAEVTVGEAGAEAPPQGVSSRDFAQGAGPSKLADGEYRFPGPAPSSGRRTVTVTRAGYSRATLVGVRTNAVTVFLKAIPKAGSEVVVGGRLGGWQGVPTLPSKSAHAGVVFKTLSAGELTHFRSDSFISPIKDTIELVGSREIPSNLVMPDHRIQVYFASIRLNKPDYRLPMLAGERTRVTGLQGQIPVKELTDTYLGGGHFGADTLNKLTFTRMGLSGEFTPAASGRVDFDATVPLAQAHSVMVSRPTFAAHVMAIAVTDLTGDRSQMVPTDIKTAINANDPNVVRPVSLAAPRKARLLDGSDARSVVTVAVGNGGRRVSGVIAPAAPQVATGAYLDTEDWSGMTALPSSVAVDAPPTGVGVLVLEDQATEAPAWIVYVLPAAGKVSVPIRAVSDGAKRVLALSRMDFGPLFDERAVDGREVLAKMQRFARSSARF